MNFTQAVRQAHADRLTGCIYARHSSAWQISTDSDALISDCNQVALPGYVQIASCQFAAATVASRESVATAANELVEIHNRSMRDLGVA